MNKHLINGPIPNSLLDEIKQTVPSNSGAEIVFFGTIRADKIEGKEVIAIDYDAYNEMAEIEFSKIISQVKAEFPINSIAIKHSYGMVKVGESSLLVYITSKHRKEGFLAAQKTVDLIKQQAPVWKKELFEDGSHSWTNSCLGCAEVAHKSIKL